MVAGYIYMQDVMGRNLNMEGEYFIFPWTEVEIAHSTLPSISEINMQVMQLESPAPTQA